MPIPLRPDFDATHLRLLARESEDANQVRRLLSLAAIYDGATRTEAAGIGGVTLSGHPRLGAEIQRGRPRRPDRP